MSVIANIALDLSAIACKSLPIHNQPVASAPVDEWEKMMNDRYEVQESPRNPGKFNVVDMRTVKAVKMGLPEDSAREEAAKLNKLFGVVLHDEEVAK